MELKIDRVGEWKVLRVGENRLDAFVAEGLKQALTEAIGDGTKKVVVDLSAVKFMDSSGLGALVFGRQRLETGGNLALCGVQPEVETILRLTRLDRVFQVIDGLECVVEKTE